MFAYTKRTAEELLNGLLRTARGGVYRRLSLSVPEKPQNNHYCFCTIHVCLETKRRIEVLR